MSDPLTVRRRLAHVLLANAASVLPSYRRRWLEAMRSEIAHIADDTSALRWAWGSLYAAYAERWRTTALLDFSAVRWGVALLLVQQAASNAILAGLVLAHKVGVLQFSGVIAHRDDYRWPDAMLSFTDAMPIWETALMLGICAFYLVAAVQVVKRSAWALWTFVGGLTLSIGHGLYVIQNPAYATIGSTGVKLALILSMAILLCGVVRAGTSSRRPA